MDTAGEPSAVRADRRASLSNLIERRLFVMAAGPLFLVYLLTATWSYPTFNDTATNSLTAWSIGTRGTLYLEDHRGLVDYNGYATWIVPAGSSVASKYPPGAPLMAVPLYAVWPEKAHMETVTPGGAFGWPWPPEIEPFAVPVPPLGPAAITAAATAAAAMGLLAMAFRLEGGTASAALIGAYLAGLGTATWSVAADQLWQHGPAMLWIAAALALSGSASVGSGLAFGAAILSRPPVAIIAAATGIYRSIRERSLRPALLLGSGAMVGLVLFLVYNAMVFGSPSVSAGYGSGFQDQVMTGVGVGYLGNLVLAAFSFSRGIFVWSPFLLILLPGLRAAWRAAPAWSRGAALGGMVYLLVQYKANSYSGIANTLSYRYPLEALAASGPLLFLSYREWVAPRPAMARAFGVASAIAVVLHFVAALELARF